MKLKKGDIIKRKKAFKPKAIVIMLDEMSEVMSGSNYKLVSSIQDSIGSIARLGRAAGVHLVLATQRPSSNVINSDLKNNIQQGVLLGDFNSSASSLIFDEDISHLSKPEIKGRGFVQSGKEILEFQSYYTKPQEEFRYNERAEDAPVERALEKEPIRTKEKEAPVVTEEKPLIKSRSIQDILSGDHLKEKPPSKIGSLNEIMNKQETEEERAKKQEQEDMERFLEEKAKRKEMIKQKMKEAAEKESAKAFGLIDIGHEETEETGIKLNIKVKKEQGTKLKLNVKGTQDLS